MYFFRLHERYVCVRVYGDSFLLLCRISNPFGKRSIDELNFVLTLPECAFDTARPDRSRHKKVENYTNTINIINFVPKSTESDTIICLSVCYIDFFGYIFDLNILSRKKIHLGIFFCYFLLIKFISST